MSLRIPVNERDHVLGPDDAPVTVYELTPYAGTPSEGSADPLANPWSGRLDGSLARELGFEPPVPTIHAAAREGIL